MEKKEIILRKISRIGYFMNRVLKRIDRIWTIIKIGEKKENEFVYLDLILIIKRREREGEERGKDRDKNSMYSDKRFFKNFF